jgi:hypothetical protein
LCHRRKGSASWWSLLAHCETRSLFTPSPEHTLRVYVAFLAETNGMRIVC